MADREKVMQWLETCANGCEDGCPYEYKNLVYRVECKADLMSDAFELLKAQEPVPPVIKQEMDGVFSDIENIAYCGNCDYKLGRLRVNYCENCGRAAKWE